MAPLNTAEVRALEDAISPILAKTSPKELISLLRQLIADCKPIEQSPNPFSLLETDSPASPDPEPLSEAALGDSDMETESVSSLPVRGTPADAGWSVVSKKKRKAPSMTPPTTPSVSSKQTTAETKRRKPSPGPASRPVSSGKKAPQANSRSGPRGPQKRPPKIVMADKTLWRNVTEYMNQHKLEYTHAAMRPDGVHITMQASDDHRKLTRYFNDKRIQYFTYALEEERQFRVVLKGIPKELGLDYVEDDLRSQNLPVVSVHRMTNFRRVPLDMVMLVLASPEQAQAIFKLTKVCGLSGIRAEPPRKRGPGQCHNCQAYGHSARFCKITPRCVKCLQSHHTRDCERNRDTDGPPACVLCGEHGHPANYRGCPKAPKPRRAAPAPKPSSASAFAVSAEKFPALRGQNSKPTAPADPSTSSVKTPTAPPKSSTSDSVAPGNLREDLRYIHESIEEVTSFVRKLRSASLAEKIKLLADHNLVNLSELF